MKKYNYIISALGICHREFAYSFTEYKERLKSILGSEESKEYVTHLRSEIETALRDPKWSWKEAAKESDFCYYDENKSEDENFEEVKNMLWDILF